MNVRQVTYEQWVAEGNRRFGEDIYNWRFVCPVCKHVCSVRDYADAGASEGMTAFSCIGRVTGGRDAFNSDTETSGPCNYAGGGLFRLNPIHVSKDGTVRETFDFAPADGVEPWSEV